MRALPPVTIEAHMQDPGGGPYFLHPGGVALLRHIFDVACDTLRDQVPDASKSRVHGVVGLAIADMARKGHVDPDYLLQNALARARAALN